MKHLKKFEATFQSGEGSGQVPEVPTGRKLRPYMIDNLKPEMGGGEVMELTKSEVMGKIKDILNESKEFKTDLDLFVGKVQSNKGNKIIDYLQIKDRKERSIGIYITDIDPAMPNSQEPYKGI